MKNLFRFFVIAFTVSVLISSVSCSSDEDTEPYYPHHCELALTIPDSYKQKESEDFDAFFSNGEAGVAITRLTFAGPVNDDLEPSMFPSEVARKYAEKNGLSALVTVFDEESYSYFSVSSGGYYTLYSFYRSRYAHFIVSYTCREEKIKQYSGEFLKYASEAYFTE